MELSRLCSSPGRPPCPAPPWMRRPPCSSRILNSLALVKKPLTVVLAEKPSRVPYEDPGRSHAQRLMQEEVQMATETPSVIQLAEATEGICLLAALALQLIPVLYASFSQTQSPVTSPHTSSLAPIIPQDSPDERPVMHEVVTVESTGRTSVETSSMSHFSLWSASLLVAGVILGSIVRRFHQNQTQLHQTISPAALTHLTPRERDEMDESLTRAFAEISHLASQVEKLRIKVGVISRDYTTSIEKSSSQSSRLKQALQEVLAQLKGTEDKIQDLSAIMEKMQGFASKQFVVVSSALRRIDRDCKALTARLGTPSSEPTILEDSAIPTEMDLHP